MASENMSNCGTVEDALEGDTASASSIADFVGRDQNIFTGQVPTNNDDLWNLIREYKKLKNENKELELQLPGKESETSSNSSEISRDSLITHQLDALSELQSSEKMKKFVCVPGMISSSFDDRQKEHLNKELRDPPDIMMPKIQSMKKTPELRTAVSSLADDMESWMTRQAGEKDDLTSTMQGNIFTYLREEDGTLKQTFQGLSRLPDDHTRMQDMRKEQDMTLKKYRHPYFLVSDEDSSERPQVGPHYIKEDKTRKQTLQWFSGLPNYHTLSRQDMRKEQDMTLKKYFLDSDEDGSEVENYEDDFEEEDSEEAGEKDLKSTLKEDLWTTLREEDETSKQTFQELLGIYRYQEEGRKVIRQAENLKHKSSFLSKLAAKQKKKGSEQDDGDDLSTGRKITETTEKSFEKELEDIRQVDSELVYKLHSEHHQMSDEDFQELLKRHLADVKNLHHQWAAEREKLDTRLREKLEMKKGTEDNAAGAALERELSVLDEKLQNDLKRRGKNIDESDLEELLENYRRQQSVLLRQRKADKSKTDEKLRQKLEEKNRKKKRPQIAEDDIFNQKIQALKSQGKLTKEDFTALLSTHLSKVDKPKQDERWKPLAKRREKKAQADLTELYTLVQESQEEFRPREYDNVRKTRLTDHKLVNSRPRRLKSIKTVRKRLDNETALDHNKRVENIKDVLERGK